MVIRSENAVISGNSGGNSLRGNDYPTGFQILIRKMNLNFLHAFVASNRFNGDHQEELIDIIRSHLTRLIIPQVGVPGITLLNWRIISRLTSYYKSPGFCSKSPITPSTNPLLKMSKAKAVVAARKRRHLADGDNGSILTEAALKGVFGMMEAGCALKFLPYTWDKERKRFKNANWFHLSIFWVHQSIAWFMGIHCVTRLGMTFMNGATPVPDRIRTINSLWSLAYFLELICFVELNTGRRAIKFYANSLFDYISKGVEHTVGSAALEAACKKIRTNVSAFVIMGLVMLVGNPPSHCVMVIDTPCAPHFVSAMFLPCKNAADNSATIVQKIPFILAENYIVTVMFYHWTFNWIMIFLGLAWLKMELTRMRMDALENSSDEVPQKYRTMQMITVLINDGFTLYLEWFPNILLGIVALLMFAVIKFWDLNILSYVMFPSCGLRCVFEAITPLALAGFVNWESFTILQHWKGKLSGDEWLRRFQKSCGEIRCTAGSLYTFENSIVLTTISNCICLTVNLLVMYR